MFVDRAMIAQARPMRLIKRVMGHQGTVLTGAGGYTSLFPLCASSGVTVCSDWSTAAANALEYRVLAIEVNYFPIVNTTSTFTAPAPCMWLVCGYSSGLVPANLDQVVGGPGFKAFNGLRPWKFAVSSKGNNDAQLWTQTNVSIVAAESFGICMSDQATAPAGPVSQTIGRFAIRYLTEFRSID
jgi:hypothetical protein